MFTNGYVLGAGWDSNEKLGTVMGCAWSLLLTSVSPANRATATHCPRGDGLGTEDGLEFMISSEFLFLATAFSRGCGLLNSRRAIAPRVGRANGKHMRNYACILDARKPKKGENDCWRNAKSR